jgi:dephospho-CoA kinase
MKKLIIGFVGEIASGKGTACDYFIEKYGAGYYKFSTIMRDILDRLYLPQARENMQNLSTVLRQNFGEDLFAKVITKDVENDTNEIVCVDGIRRVADIKYLKTLPNFHLIHIYADEMKRYNRIIERSENPDDKNKTFEQFKLDQTKETEITIPQVVAEAETKINNDGTKEELYQQLETLLTELQA